MEWLFIIGIIWAISSYLYHTSTFEPDLTGIEEQLQYELDVLRGKIEQKPEPSQPTPKRVLHPLTHLSFVADRTPIFDPQPLYPNQFMSAIEKKKYMISAEWLELRTLVFTRDNHTCQSCGSKIALNCHHIMYDRLGAENLEDLITLCKSCHQYQHDIYGYLRQTRFWPLLHRDT